MQMTEEVAIQQGLDIRNYGGKWRRAKDMALRAEKDSYPEGSAALYAYRLFMEMGGGNNGGFYGLLNEDTLVLQCG